MAHIHIKKKEETGFAPVKGEESESRTWFTSSGDPIRGMPSAREPVPLRRDKEGKAIWDKIEESRFHNIKKRDSCKRTDCEWYCKRREEKCNMYMDVKKCLKWKK